MPDSGLVPGEAGERAGFPARGDYPSPRTPLAGFDPATLPDVTPVPADVIRSLAAELSGLLGVDAVLSDQAARLTASTDWAHMSPVLEPLLPGGVADVVVKPRDAAGIAAAVGAAHRHRVPVTVRGQGTGNYGQGIPLYGGLVLDTSRASAVISVGDGEITAEAGASFVMLEKAARATGQELSILPSTVGSTIAGFIAGGSGGTGSIANGAIWDGYMRSLLVVPCTDDATPVRVPFPENTAMAHAFGVSGVIAEATVELRPARTWTGLFASFPDTASAVAAGEALFDLEPTPRLLSLDEAGIVATYRPIDPAMPGDRASVRGIVTTESVPAATKIVESHGGRVDAVRPKGPALIASMSYNHTTYRVRKLRPELTHLQCMGPGLTRRRAEVADLVPESLIHLEGFRTAHGRDWVSMLFLRYDGPDTLYRQMTELANVEVYVDDPHTWVLHHLRLPAVRAAARQFDPDGLLNPGKLLSSPQLSGLTIRCPHPHGVSNRVRHLCRRAALPDAGKAGEKVVGTPAMWTGAMLMVNSFWRHVTSPAAGASRHAAHGNPDKTSACLPGSKIVDRCAPRGAHDDPLSWKTRSIRPGTQHFRNRIALHGTDRRQARSRDLLPR